MKKHRIAQGNRDLYFLYVDDHLIGTVRRALSGRWYPQLREQQHLQDAVDDVYRAHFATAEYRDVG